MTTDSAWRHPLMHKPARNFSRRHLLGLSGGAMLGAATLSVLPSVAAQDATPEVSGESDAVDLLRAAVTAMADLETFHFLLETTRGTTSFMGMLELESVEGDIRRPFDFETLVKAKLPLGEIELTAIGLDGTVAIEDPLAGDGSWITLGADPTALTLLNPDFLLLSSVSILQDAQLDGEEEFDDVDCSVVLGVIDIEGLTGFLTEQSQDFEIDFASRPLDITVWIDAERHIRGIEFLGALFESEPDNTTRLLTFSAFNDPVEIAAPPV